ncbi:MAG: phosphoenolpyruvate--protein phosphotransferase [candidate division Zixibacteria bacterium]|nr:phosphoenolpyruvate--protein phosphotransferase [candidate division Zixibacteria bacterium]
MKMMRSKLSICFSDRSSRKPTMSKASGERYELTGISASPGVACGEAALHISGFPEYKEEIVPEKQIKAEIGKLEKAFDKTRAELETMRNHASASNFHDLPSVLDAQLLILSDVEFLNQIKDKITESRYSAVSAFTASVNENIEMFSRNKNIYMTDMIGDIETVSSHILTHLLGNHNIKQIGFKNPSILFAAYFTPAEIMDMPDMNVVGFVTEKGGAASHMGLFARSLGIPAVVAVKAHKKIEAGNRMIVDGNRGVVIVNPSDEEYEQSREMSKQSRIKQLQMLKLIRELPSATRDEHKVDITANLDIPTDIDKVLAQEQIGIGLYRTEFLYLQYSTFPTEEQQKKIYTDIARTFAPQAVILRTFDLGGDKLTDFYKSDIEINPALGWRGIRFALDVPNIFETQVRAILRASSQKNIKIMLPMISTLEEVRSAREKIELIKKDMKKKRVPFDHKIEVGIMIETPAAVQIADALAREVDFFSIGTNDLTQYTLAVDRNNLRVARHFQAFHPAILKSIKITVEAGHKTGIPVGICGEIAGDPLAAKLLVGLGVDSLSMNPASIAVIMNILHKIDFEEAMKFARKVLKYSTEQEVTRALVKDYDRNFSNNSTRKKAEVKNG